MTALTAAKRWVHRAAWLAFASLAWPIPATATPSSELEELTIEDLMDLETDIATRVPMSPRDLPGIITILHRDDILRSGARDLLDLLQRVPGLQAELDVQGVLGLAVRGQWAADGRVLLLVDGQELTEPMYGASPLGGRFALANLQRVEVIRGPATARYGGGASAAVISVTTLAAGGPDHGQAHVQACARSTGLGCAIAGASFVHHEDDVRVGLAVHGSDTRMSAGRYEDFWGDGFEAHEVNRRRQLQVSGTLDVGSAHLRVGAEHFAMRQQDVYDEVAESPVRNWFDTAWLRGWVDRSVGSRWVVTPSFALTRASPWNSGATVGPDDSNFYDRRNTRGDLGVGALGQLGRGVQLDLGAGFRMDHIRSGPRWKEWPLPSGTRSAMYWNAYGRAELLWVTRHLNLMAGVRAAYQDPMGPRVVPRLAITTSSDRAHAKLLLAGAYRAPTYEQLFPIWDDNIDAPDLTPEASGTVELEVGVRPADGVQLRANGFLTAIRNPIVFASDEDDWDYFFNGDKVASGGAEGEVRFRRTEADVTVTYAFSHPIGDPIDTFALTDRPGRVAAMANHSAAVTAALSPRRGVWVTPVARVLGPRTVFSGVDEDDELLESDLPAAVLLDLTVRAEDLAQGRLDVELGIHDLLGQDPGWHQPYAGWHAPMPGRGRELRLRASYGF